MQQAGTSNETLSSEAIENNAGIMRFTQTTNMKKEVRGHQNKVFSQPVLSFTDPPDLSDSNQI